MPVPVGRGDVQALMDEGALLLEVLDAGEYARAHLPGAVNMPARMITPTTMQGFDRSRPTIAYCYDLQCDLSPRAARLLERYRFEFVYDYEAGKADWLAYGLPFEGDGTPVVADLLEPCFCALADDAIEDVFVRLGEQGFDTAVIVDESDIVLGAVAAGTLQSVLEIGPGEDPVAAHMVPSPTTYRPQVPVEKLGRLLVIEDALRACFSRWPDHCA